MTTAVQTDTELSPTGIDSVLHVLLAGLLSDNPQLIQRCRLAIQGMGGCAVPVLGRAAGQSRLAVARSSGCHSWLAPIVSGFPTNKTQKIKWICDALLECVRLGKPKLYDMAIQMLECLGPQIRNQLIVEAVTCVPKPAQCVRLLQAAGRLSGPVAFQERRDLNLMTMSKYLRIRAEAERLNELLGPMQPHWRQQG